MAHFTYNCEDHGNFKISLEKREKEVDCPICGKKSKPVIKIGTTQIMERLDNGAMARAVERLHNIEDIIEERADKNTKEFMEKIGETEEN